MDAWWCHAEEALHISFGRRLAMDEGVGPDEGEVLPLEWSESRIARPISSQARGDSALPCRLVTSRAGVLLGQSIAVVALLLPAEHQDQQRGSILAVPRLLHLVVLRLVLHCVCLSDVMCPIVPPAMPK